MGYDIVIKQGGTEVGTAQFAEVDDVPTLKLLSGAWKKALDADEFFTRAAMTQEHSNKFTVAYVDRENPALYQSVMFLILFNQLQPGTIQATIAWGGFLQETPQTYELVVTESVSEEEADGGQSESDEKDTQKSTEEDTEQ